MDLPIDDATVTCDTFADVVCAALVGCTGDVVVVGHSYGGMVIPLVAARRPVRHLVYVCAYVSEIGRSLDEQLRDDPESFNPAAYEGFTRDAQARSVWIDERIAREIMYADCDEDIARRRSSAYGRTRLPQTSCRFRSPNFRRCPALRWCAPTTSCFGFHGRGGPPPGSAATSSSCPAAIHSNMHKSSSRILAHRTTPRSTLM